MKNENMKCEAMLHRLGNYKCEGQLSFDDINWSIERTEDKNQDNFRKDVIMEEEPDLPY